MNKTTIMYLQSARTTIQELDNLEPDHAEQAKHLRRYEDELAELTGKLKEKHGYDELMKDIAATKNATDNLTGDITRYGTCFIVQAIAELFRAYPDQHALTNKRLAEHWGIEIIANSNVNTENYVACFNVFASHVCDPDWWAAHPIEYNDAEKTIINIEDDMPFDWSPCMTILFKKELIQQNQEFTDWHGKILAELSAAWAEKFLKDTGGDDAKQQALLTALETKYRHTDTPSTRLQV